jgi:HNH endonuclease
MKHHPLILQLDIMGNPTRWVTYETAAYYVAKDLIAWKLDDENGFTIYGGTNHITGNQSTMDLSTIIAIKGEIGTKGLFKVPTLTNRALFRRDQFTCAYCGSCGDSFNLTRDHVLPTSKQGKNIWQNVVTSCGSCNRMKDDRTPEEAGMKLLYIPYVPSRSEYLLLMNRNVLANQMEFLKAKIPSNSHIHISDFRSEIAIRIASISTF